MSDAPKRIGLVQFFGMYALWNSDEFHPHECVAQYIRADLHEAEVQALRDPESAYARGFHDAQHIAKVEGRLVIVDSPELVALREERDRLRVSFASDVSRAVGIMQSLSTDHGRETDAAYLAAMVDLMGREAEKLEAALATALETPEWLSD